MNERQKRFADEYLIDLNAEQAAIRAGYSPAYARGNAHKMVANSCIQEYIQKRMAEKEDELIAKQDEVLKYLTSVMRREHKENIVVTLQTKTEKWVTDPDTGKLKKQSTTEDHPAVVEIPAKLSDSNKAAELLGKRYGLFSDKVTLDVEPITIVNDLKE